MKLSPEQVRARAKYIADAAGSGEWQTNEILKLIEEATGEKIPEPFDESKVGHGSIWRDGCEEFVILKHFTGNYSVAFLPDVEVASASPFAPNSPRSDVIQWLTSRRDVCYLGQYDFAAGLPKEAK